MEDLGSGLLGCVVGKRTPTFEGRDGVDEMLGWVSFLDRSGAGSLDRLFPFSFSSWISYDDDDDDVVSIFLLRLYVMLSRHLLASKSQNQLGLL